MAVNGQISSHICTEKTHLIYMQYLKMRMFWREGSEVSCAMVFSWIIFTCWTSLCPLARQ